MFSKKIKKKKKKKESGPMVNAFLLPVDVFGGGDGCKNDCRGVW